MSKLTNIMKKGKLWTILLAFVLAAGLVIGIFFGLNTASSMKDASTLTVSTDRYAFENYAKDLQNECEKIFDNNNVNYSYKVEGETSGNDYEMVYVFEKDTDLSAVKTAIKEVIASKTADGAAWEGSFIDVATANEEVQAVTTKGYALRGAIACAVMVVLAIAYVAIRYRWDMGLLVGGAILLSMFLTVALISLVRVSVTNSVAYVVFGAGMLTAVMSLFTLNNMRGNQVEASEESIADSVALKEVCTLAIAVLAALVALIVAGLIASTSLVWFAVVGVIGLVSAAVISLIYMPSVYLPLKQVADKKVASKTKHYVGAKAKDEE